jgi:hypothetical protein
MRQWTHLILDDIRILKIDLNRLWIKIITFLFIVLLIPLGARTPTARSDWDRTTDQRAKPTDSSKTVGAAVWVMVTAQCCAENSLTSSLFPSLPQRTQEAILSCLITNVYNKADVLRSRESPWPEFLIPTETTGFPIQRTHFQPSVYSTYSHEY